MAFTADLSTDVGKVRLLLADLDSSAPVFPDDAQIQAFLDLELGDIKCAAALGMETVAGNKAMTMRFIQLLDLKLVNGADVAKGLLTAAQRFRDTSNNDWSGFDIAEVTDDSIFVLREKYWKLLVSGAA